MADRGIHSRDMKGRLVQEKDRGSTKACWSTAAHQSGNPLRRMRMGMGMGSGMRILLPSGPNPTTRHLGLTTFKLALSAMATLLSRSHGRFKILCCSAASPIHLEDRIPSIESLQACSNPDPHQQKVQIRWQNRSSSHQEH